MIKKWHSLKIEQNNNMFYSSDSLLGLAIIEYHPITNTPINGFAYEIMVNEHVMLVQYCDGLLERWEVDYEKI